VEWIKKQRKKDAFKVEVGRGGGNVITREDNETILFPGLVQVT